MMKENFEHIDQIFNDGLKDLNIAPPAEAWNNIAPEIVKRDKAVIFLYKTIAVAAILTIGFFVFFHADSTAVNQSKELNIANNSFENKPFQQIEKTNPSSNNEIITQENNIKDIPINKSNASDHNLISKSNHIAINQPIEATSVSVIDSVENYNPEKAKPLDTKPAPLFAINEQPAIIDQKETNLADEVLMQYNLQLAEFLNSDDKPGDNYSISLSGQASPLLASIENSKQAENNNILTANKAATSKQEDVLAYTAGLVMGIKNNSRFSMSSGIMYTQMGTIRQESQLFEMGNALQEIAMSNTTDNIVTNSPSNYNAYIPTESKKEEISLTDNYIPSRSVTATPTFEITENLQYIEVPLNMSYKIIDRKIDFNISGGLATNFLIGNAVMTTSTYSGSTSKMDITALIDKIKFATNFGIGLEYPFSKKIKLSVEPTLKYYFQTENNLPTSQLKPLALGIYTGINYQF